MDKCGIFSHCALITLQIELMSEMAICIKKLYCLYLYFDYILAVDIGPSCAFLDRLELESGFFGVYLTFSFGKRSLNSKHAPNMELLFLIQQTQKEASPFCM